jgi:WD40 repeat protein
MSKRKPLPELPASAFKRTKLAPAAITINCLNEELLLHVFSHLDVPNLCNTLLVCKKWCRIGSDNKIWRDLYHANFFKRHRFQTTLSIGIERKAELDWKSFFKLRYNWNRGVCRVKNFLFQASVPAPTSFSLSSQASSSAPGTMAPPGMFKNFLIASRNKIIVTLNMDYEIQVWSCLTEKLIASCSVRDWLKDERKSSKLGQPTVLIVNPVGAFKFCIGFDTGSFIVGSLEGLKTQAPYLIPKQIAVLDHARYGAIVHIVQRQNLLAVYTSRSSIILYSFSNGVTKTLSVMKSYIDPSHEVALTIRSVHYQRYLFCISLAYFQLTLSGEWIPCVQEILCNPEGRIINTRMSTYCPNNTTSYLRAPKWSHGYSSKPMVLSYNHPYLLAGFSDNTMSLYIARSAECCLEIQPRQRLWGHTSGINHVFVKAGGTAVSVSSRGREIRWWDLTSNSEINSYPIKLPADDGIRVIEALDANKDAVGQSDASTNMKANTDTTGESSADSAINTGTLPHPDMKQDMHASNNISETTGKFFTFDEEMILLEMETDRQTYLTICDFQ